MFRCVIVCVSLLLLGMSPRESFYGADCEFRVSIEMFSQCHGCCPFETTSGQAVAPEVQLRDLVWSDESFFRGA